MAEGITILLRAEPIFEIGSFQVTNTILLSWLAVAVLLFFGLAVSRKIRTVPGGGQNLLEAFVEGFLGLMEPVLGNRRLAEKYFPLVSSIFLFVLTSNWLGIFPFLGAMGFFEGHGAEKIFMPLFRSPASDLNFTLALAVFSVIAVNVVGAKELGLFRHLSKYFNFSNPINFFVGILEFFSEFAKMISFSFRLFGNVFAGEVLLIIMAALAPYVAPIPFLFLEIFVGLIQAFIFAMLTMVFIAGSVTSEHSH
jgi:F-type H+-transporting ATPase subunit a